MFSPYITLPTRQDPICPNRCAICDAAAPEHSFRYAIGVPVLIWGCLARWLPRRRLVGIPVCASCRRAHLVHDFAFFIVILLSVSAAELSVVLNRNFFAANPLATLPATLAILGPVAAWSWWRIVRPDIQIHSHLFGISYQFRGKRFFEEFMQANAGLSAPSCPDQP
jgi:hypothetical protein